MPDKKRYQAPAYEQVAPSEVIDAHDALAHTVTLADNEIVAIQAGDSEYEEDIISIDEALDKLGFGRFQYTILTASGLCFAADAMQVILLSFLSLVLKEEWNLSSRETEYVTSTLFAGAMVGTLVLGPLADSIGRRPVFLIAASVISAAGFLTALAPNYTAVLCALFGVGLGVGGLTVPFDLLAEFLPSQGRGKNLLLIEYFWTIGCLYVVLTAYMLLQREEPAWRIHTALCAVPCVLSLMMGYCFVPESPRWLASKGRLDEAMDILRKAAVINGNDGIFPEGLTLLPEPEEKHAAIADLFTPRWREITLRLWGAWGAFSFGYFGTLLVTTRVFAQDTKVGDHSNESFDYGAIFVSSLAEFAGTTLVIIAVDRLGRIPSQVVSYALAGILVCVLCVLAESGAPRLVLVVIGFAARVFEMSGTCVTWVSTAEILTTEVRGTGHSTANAMARIGAFFCPFLVEGDTSLILVGVAMLTVHTFTVFCVVKLPETAGRDMGVVDNDAVEEPQAEETMQSLCPSTDDDDVNTVSTGELT